MLGDLAMTTRRWAFSADVAVFGGLVALWKIGYSPGQAWALVLLAVIVGAIGAMIAHAARR